MSQPATQGRGLVPPGALWLLPLALLYTAAFVVLTYPAWAGWDRVALGHADSDIWKHLWGDAWFARELGQVFPVPTYTALIGAPDGGLLYNLDPLTGAFVALTSGALGIVGAHTAAVCLAVVGGGLAAAWFASRLSGDRAAAALAGAVYAFSAQILSLAVASGVGETAHIAWMPLSLVAGLQICQRPRWSAVVWGALCLALSAVGSWYYGLVTGLALVGLVLWYAASAGWRIGQLRAAGPMLAVMVLAALTLVAPLALSFFETVSADAALNSVASAGVSHRDLMPRFNGAVVSLRDLVVPREPRVNVVRDWLIFSNHPGVLALLLAGFAVVLRSRLGAGLLLAGLGLLAVGFGPVVHVDRQTPFVPNLVFLLSEQLPALGMIRNLERFQVPFSLCLALVASLGASRLLSIAGLEGRRRQVAGLGLAALAIVDGWWVSGLPFPLPTAAAQVPSIYAALPADQGGIIELPISDRPAGLAFWAQTQHLRPLPLNLEGSLAPQLRSNPLMWQLIAPALLNLYDTAGEATLAPEQLEAGRLALAEQGFSFVVLQRRPDGRDDDEVQRLAPLLGQVLGPPLLKSDGGYEVYTLYRRAP